MAILIIGTQGVAPIRDVAVLRIGGVVLTNRNSNKVCGNRSSRNPISLENLFNILPTFLRTQKKKII